jgi:hypothetical protein
LTLSLEVSILNA